MVERARIGTLAGGIAHDFNNILTALHGFAEPARESIDLYGLSRDVSKGSAESLQRGVDRATGTATVGQLSPNGHHIGGDRAELVDPSGLVDRL